MARATRSTTQQQEKEKEKHSDPAVVVPRAKLVSKKRKRASISNDEDQPSSKQLRTDWDMKVETSSEPDQTLSKEDMSPHLPYAGDMSIDPADSQKILDVLEMVDTQGLLDRVFPLPADSSISQPKPHSLRTLLKESSQHSLSILRCAIHNLLPISSHPRSRPSTPAAQQLRFCNFALSLLHQASFHTIPLLDLETILSLPSESKTDADINGDSKISSTESSPPSPVRRRRYALMQRFSGGDWWTSLDSDFALPSLGSKDLKDLHTAHAELVAILPSPSMPYPNDTASDSSTKSLAPPPTLGSLISKKASGQKAKLPSSRRVSCGAFLDYGPYASFAPIFDQDGVEIGRTTLGEVAWETDGRRKRKIKEKLHIVSTPEESSDVIMGDNPLETKSLEREQVKEEVEHSLNGLFPPDQVAMIRSALSNLELENAVHDLLERTRVALMRLEELQSHRLSGKAGGSSEVAEGSEEWDTAQEIMNSLVVLTSLRPRQSSDNSELPPLIPPAAILHKLHRTLPRAPSRGWHGTLPASRSSALRDDSTLRIRSGAPSLPTNATPAPPAPAATAIPAGTVTPAAVYPGYSYAGYTPPYRPTYTPYKAGQTPAYYTAYAQGQTPASAYYPNQNYNATGQQQYSYGSWYNYQPQTTAGTSSGRGTPQPVTGAVATSTALPVNYAGFFNNGQQQPTGQRAVANTAIAIKPYTPGAATGTSTAYVTPTLPSYARNAAGGVGTPQPGTPGAVVGYQQPNYYPHYAQPTPSTVQ